MKVIVVKRFFRIAWLKSSTSSPELRPPCTLCCCDLSS